MRGYGRSSVYPRHEDYAIEQAVKDMLELLDKLGAERAIWVGHDWGSPVVWSLASHHPDRCIGVANLCVPYFAKGFTLKNFVSLVDRSVYPTSQRAARISISASASIHWIAWRSARGTPNVSRRLACAIAIRCAATAIARFSAE
jgi:pimeloyl-ACP methyl ester carboxylesterase